MASGKRIGRLLFQSPKRLDLVGQNVKNQLRVQFRFVHMSRIQTPVVIVLDQVVIGVARKCERIEPKRIDRRRSEPRQVWSVGDKMRKIETNDIMPDQVPIIRGLIFKLLQRLCRIAFPMNYKRGPIAGDTGKRKQTRRSRLDFKIDGKTGFQKFPVVVGQSAACMGKRS